MRVEWCWVAAFLMTVATAASAEEPVYGGGGRGEGCIGLVPECVDFSRPAWCRTVTAPFVQGEVVVSSVRAHPETEVPEWQAALAERLPLLNGCYTRAATADRKHVLRGTLRLRARPAGRERCPDWSIVRDSIGDRHFADCVVATLHDVHAFPASTHALSAELSVRPAPPAVSVRRERPVPDR